MKEKRNQRPDGNAVGRADTPMRVSRCGLQVFLGPVHGLQAVGGVDLLEDIVDVGLDGVRAEVQSRGDFRVLGAGGHHLEHFHFAIGQVHLAA